MSKPKEAGGKEKGKIFGESLKQIAIQGYNEEKLSILKRLEVVTMNSDRQWMKDRLVEIDKRIAELISLT